MKLHSLLKKDHVFPRLQAEDKRGAIGEILRQLQEAGALEKANGTGFGPDRLAEELMEREGKGTTGLGAGVGYPHTRVEGFGDFLVALATVPRGIEYDAPDDQPVRLILLAVVPPEKNNLLLGVMAAVSRLVGDPELVRNMVEAEDRDALWELLQEAELEVKGSLTAGDIMKREHVVARPEMTLAEVAVLMHEEHLDALPVVGEENELLGEITARELFAACVPPYFSEMPSLRFARDFDAFEHFFAEKAHRKLGDFLGGEFPAIDPDTPLAEVIARLTHKGISTVYVARDGKLVGVIDNFSIIDKVLSV